MDFDDAIAVAKQNVGSTIIRNQEGSFHVKLNSGEIIDDEGQGCRPGLKKSKSDKDDLKIELLRLKNEILVIGSKLEKKEQELKAKVLELESKENSLSNLENSLIEKKDIIKSLNEKIANSTSKNEELLSDLDNLKHILNKVDPNRFADFKKEREKEKIENKILERLKGLSGLSLMEIEIMNNTAISLGLKQSTIDKIEKSIILKKKANDQLSPSKVVVGTTEVRVETVNPFTKA